MSKTPRSNSLGLLVGVVLAVAIIAATSRIDRSYARVLSARSALLSFGLLVLCIAIAEIRSGYAWKNLASGNRGVARAESPRQFWLSVIVHVTFAAGISAFGLLFNFQDATAADGLKFP